MVWADAQPGPAMKFFATITNRNITTASPDISMIAVRSSLRFDSRVGIEALIHAMRWPSLTNVSRLISRGLELFSTHAAFAFGDRIFAWSGTVTDQVQTA